MNLLYRKTLVDGVVRYSQVRKKIPLAGELNPFKKGLTEAVRDSVWTMTEAEIVRGVLDGQTDVSTRDKADEFALIVDLKPGADHVNLYEIKQVWGMATRDLRGQLWSPLCLQLRTLFRDGQSYGSFDEVEQQKLEFTDPGDNECVFEFLYQIRKEKSGTWTWGTPGAVNGCLLFPKHMHVLFERIREESVRLAPNCTPRD